jgi:uracil-DNA glycosylase
MKILPKNSWQEKLQTEIEKPYFSELMNFIQKEYESGTIYPKHDDMFTALHLCPFGQVKVVIIGQDPYHGDGQAHGLAFSVPDETPLPPSLRNIYRELSDDIGIESKSSGDLSRWAEQGVLLLNSVLTVRAGVAGSHRSRGWEEFTDAIIHHLSTELDHLIFILWGRDADKKSTHIDEGKHLVIRDPHPSPLSAHRGFFGSKPFSRTNTYLTIHGKENINW